MSLAPGTSLPIHDRCRVYWDLALLLLFVATALAHITGTRWHEWLGAILVPAILAHLTSNWSWLVSAVAKAFHRARGEQQFNRVLDLLLFLAMTVVVVSGLMISRYFLPMLGIDPPNDSFWHAIHDSSASLVMISLGVHLAMHLKWALQRLRPVVNE